MYIGGQIPLTMSNNYVLPLMAAALYLVSCGTNDGTDSGAPQGANADQAEARPLFLSVPADSSGVLFTNTIVENQQQNYYTYEYMYNGGGVAVGDINNDGLPDLYFTGNLMPDKLYLNKGGMRFEDITATAIGEAGQQGWHTGVTMADVNNDGHLDIYVCRAGWYKEPEKRANLLYINNGDLTFTESASSLGVADTTRSTQGAFFDMDKDGDLDLFVINTPLQGPKLSNLDVERMIKERRSPTDRLYRNDNGRFTDITAEAGVWNMGYGLGVAISDYDGNGYPDIYVANDYIEHDFLYMNQGNGRFKEEIKQRTRHISNFGMGCDASDYDNDGLTDIIVLDMVSEDHVRSKKNMGAMSTDKFWQTVNAGYHYQFMSNTLQRNNGNGTFSEVGQLAGVSKTDWSWAALLADLDNDGWKDLLVTNGYKRDMRDNDYMRASEELKSQKGLRVEQLFDLVPSQKIRNYLFKNKGDLTFTNVSESWGFRNAVNSNGATYADLDGDGDLDLVINNMDERAEIYANQSVEQGKDKHIKVDLEARNTAQAIGARVVVRTASGEQTQEVMPTRGFQSCTETILLFGLGDATVADVTVHWPNGGVSRFEGVASGTRLAVPRSSAKPFTPEPASKPVFADHAVRMGLDHKDVENVHNDFDEQVLLPHKGSEYGPLMSTGDANGDGLVDLYIGGSRDEAGVLFLQNASGTFRKAPSQPWAAHKDREDMGSLFFDADGDGDQDLLVASGSNETDLYYDLYGNRLYRNDGKGNFTYDPGALPMLQTSTMRVAASDIDGDGDLDLFVGGRAIPGQYPQPPRSYLLLNDGAGRFADATQELAPDLMQPGMVTDAGFMDHDGDGDEDLVLVGEWMPISFYENNGGHFTNVTDRTGLKETEGWWFSMEFADLDGDGDKDILCGNLGWNSKFHGTPDHPVHLYWSDFDGNGKGDIVLAKESKGHLLPVRGRECSSQQCPMITDKFSTYDAFANADLGQIYGQEKLGNALHLQVRHMLSCVLINEGKGRYTLKDLPMAAQVAPVNGFAVTDWNGDGKVDIVLAGNMWGAEVETTRYDAGTGLLLLGQGDGTFEPVSITKSGIFAWNNVKDVALLPLADGSKAVAISNNSASLEVFRPSSGKVLLSAR